MLALGMNSGRRYDPRVSRPEPSTLWTTASTLLGAVAVGLFTAGIAFATTRKPYSFWTGGPMIGAYAVAVISLLCFAGAVRQWPFPLSAHDLRADRRRAPEPASSTSSLEPPKPADPPSLGPDCEGLSAEQVGLLTESLKAFHRLRSDLAELEQTPPQAARFHDVAGRTQQSLARTANQLDLIRHQVTIHSWPHREWALDLGSIPTTTLQRIKDFSQRSDHSALCSSLDRLMKLVTTRYPSLRLAPDQGSRRRPGDS
jgi:hypothetical protein